MDQVPLWIAVDILLGPAKIAIPPVTTGATATVHGMTITVAWVGVFSTL